MLKQLPKSITKEIMYQYKCKSIGDCSVANSGEYVKSETMLNDPKCSDCGCALELVEGSGSGGGSKKSGASPKLVPMIAAGIAAAAIAGGASWYLLGSKPAQSIAIIPPSAEIMVEEKVVTPTAETASSGLAPSETETSLARRDADEKLRQGEFSEAERKAARSAALEMIKAAVAKMGQGDLNGAEKELQQAKERDATEPLIYYNLAIVHLRQNQPEEALRHMEASFMAGFKHFEAMDQDTDIDPLRKSPKFQELLNIYRKNV